MEDLWTGIQWSCGALIPGLFAMWWTDHLRARPVAFGVARFATGAFLACAAFNLFVGIGHERQAMLDVQAVGKFWFERNQAVNAIMVPPEAGVSRETFAKIQAAMKVSPFDTMPKPLVEIIPWRIIGLLAALWVAAAFVAGAVPPAKTSRAGKGEEGSGTAEEGTEKP